MHCRKGIIILVFSWFLLGFCFAETNTTTIADRVAAVEKELEKYKSGEAASIQKTREFQRELDNAQACQLMRELPFFCPANSLSTRAEVLREARNRGIAVIEGLQYWTVVTLTCASVVLVLSVLAIFLAFLWNFGKRPGQKKVQSESEQKMAENREYLAQQRELLADLKTQVREQQQTLNCQVEEGTMALETKIAQRNAELEQKFLQIETELEKRVERKKVALEVQLSAETHQLQQEKNRLESEIARHEGKLQQKKAEFKSVENTLQQSKADLVRTQAEAASAQQKLDLLRAFKK